MTSDDPAAPRRANVRVAIVVALLHVAAAIALVHAFAPQVGEGLARNVTAAFTVTVTTPPPSPESEPVPTRPEKAGAAGEAGRKAVPKAVAAPISRIVLATQAAPAVSGTGSDIASGARDAGSGSGAGGQGNGTGAGTGGNGTGGGATRAVKLSGDINSARDYPPASRELRLGDHVIVALTVGVQGRVTACRVVRASRDPQADQITCRLATDRFRFRPATNAAGDPVEAIFGWKQSWFDPRTKS